MDNLRFGDLSPAAQNLIVRAMLGEFEGSPPTPHPHEWRPIEYSPKCGTQILLLAGDDVRVGSYNDASGDPDSMWEFRFINGSVRYVGYVPTHFQYLPTMEVVKNE